MKLSLLFCVCILVRFSFAYFVSRLYDSKLRYLFVVFFFMISLGFVFNYISKIRTYGAFGQKIWWDAYRPIHALLYGLAAILLLYRHKYTYTLILIDTIIGVYGHINNY